MDCSLPGSSVHGVSPGNNTRVGCHALPHGIFPTQGSNPGFPLCRQILCQLSHQGSPRILEWVSYPFSSRSSRPRNRTRISCIAGRFFTNWAIREALKNQESQKFVKGSVTSSPSPSDRCHLIQSLGHWPYISTLPTFATGEPVSIMCVS